MQILSNETDLEEGENMTLAEIKELDCDVITPAQAAGVLKCDPHFIRLMSGFFAVIAAMVLSAV